MLCRRLAGYKYDQQSTHLLRRSHATVGERRADLIEATALKAYLGHERVHGGATDVYIDRHHMDLMVAEMRPTHREYLSMPSPESILARLPGFVPPRMVGKSGLEEVWQEYKSEQAEALWRRDIRRGLEPLASAGLLTP